MKIWLRTKGLTLKECNEIVQVLRESPDVQHAELTPPRGILMNRGPQASISAMDILVVVDGFAASHLLSKPLEDFGKGLSDEMGFSDWGRNVGTFLKSIAHRPAPYTPSIVVYSMEPRKHSEETTP